MPILFSIPLWHWFAKWSLLVKFKMWGDLNSVIRLPLCIFNLSIWKSFCMVGQHQNDHFDVVLQTMQKDHDAWFRKDLALMPKVGIMMFWSKMTICHLWLFLFFPFIFLSISLFVFEPKFVVLGSKSLHTIKHTFTQN